MSDNPEETANYLRFVSLFIDVATGTVLKVFCFLIPDKNIGKFLCSIKKEKLLTDKVINKKQYNLLSALRPDEKKFDISLLITLITNSDVLPPPKEGWKSSPKTSDISASADILRLRDIRNNIIAHKPRAALYNVKFERLWAELEKILTRLNDFVEKETTEELAQTIDEYRKRSLDVQNDTIYKQKLEELCENCNEISRLQKRMEELCQKCNEFTRFFQKTPEKYSQYVQLLFEGGTLVLRNVLKDGLSKAKLKLDLQTVLYCKRNELAEKIGNEDLVCQIFQSTEDDSFHINIDIQTWDIIVLAEVIELALGNSHLTERFMKKVRIIRDARKKYAENALKALADKVSFYACCEDLVSSIEVLSLTLDEDIQKQCDEHINRYKEQSDENQGTDYEVYLNQLKAHGTNVKNLSELHQETIEKLNECFKQMKESGIDFINEHVLSLKMITLGDNSEKKRIAEDVLLRVWQAALARSDNSTEFEAVRLEIDKILEELHLNQGVQVAGVKRECILLSVRCSSCQNLPNVISYLKGELFKEHVDSISRELSDICGDVIVIEGHLTFESLNEILTHPRNESASDGPYTDGISLPVVCHSPRGIQSVLKIIKSESFTNSINKIADSLSSYMDETISLKVIPDLKDLTGIHEETDSETASSSDSHIEENEYSDRFQMENNTKNVIISLETEPDSLSLTSELVFDEHLIFDELLEDVKEIGMKANETVKAEYISEDVISEDVMSKEVFKKDIIRHYRQIHSKLKIGSIMEEVQFDRLYVPPFPIYDITARDQNEITKLHDVFNDESCPCNSIYITSETGVGKTVFMKWLTLCWCDAHSMDKDREGGKSMTDIFTGEDIEEMAKFEFLFYVSVGDVKCDKYHVDQLIYNSIANNLTESRTLKMDFLETILEAEKCLIILDGIDECTHSQSGILPEHNKRTKLSTLTTCTTQTFERLNVKSHGIKKHIQLEVLGKEKSEKLSKNILSVLSQNDYIRTFSSRISSGIFEFEKMLIEKNVVHFISYPVLLTLLLSMWIVKEKIDRSQCEIYTEIIMELIKRASVREAFSQQLLMFKTGEPAKEECLENCGPYFRLFMMLGHLAYYTLFGEQSEPCFDFDQDKAVQILSSDESFPPLDVIEAGLNTGILDKRCKSGYIGLKYNLMFFHKSVHEFLAALYMSYNTFTMKQMKSKCQSVSSFLEYKDLFVFLSGLNKSSAAEIINGIIQVIHTDEVLLNYRYTVNSERAGEIMYIQNMVVDCIKESRNSGRGKMCVALEDAVMDSSCENVLYRTNLKKILSKSTVQTLSIEEFDTQEREYDKYSLLEGLDLSSLQKLKIDGQFVLRKISDIRTFSAVKYVHFKRIVLAESCDSFKRLIDFFQFKSIKALGLETVSMTHEQGLKILQLFNSKTEMTQIVLRSVKCRSHKICPQLELDFSNHKDLQILEVYDIPWKITNGQTNAEKLEVCKIGNLPNESFSTFFRCIKKTSNLKSLVCIDVFRELDIKDMVIALPKLTKLVCLDLSSIVLDKNIIRLPSKMKHLKEIKLFDVSMTDDALRVLIESIEEFTQKVTVEIVVCTVKPYQGFRRIKEHIRSSSMFTIIEDDNEMTFSFESKHSSTRKPKERGQNLAPKCVTYRFDCT